MFQTLPLLKLLKSMFCLRGKISIKTFFQTKESEQLKILTIIVIIITFRNTQNQSIVYPRKQYY